MKKLVLLLMALAIGFGARASDSPKREFRSTWLTTYQRIDWPAYTSLNNPAKCKQDLINYLDMHQDRNFTGVCLHVRTWADAVYASSYEPWSEWLTGTRGKNPGWDPLAFAVEECHKRGLECYAWINPFRFNRNNRARTTAQDRAVLAKEGWIIDNGTVSSHDEYQVFNPALPEVREYLRKIIREIYTKYRIDGMLFDDYFYPNGIPANSTAQDYVYFQQQNPGVQGTDFNIREWRRQNINLFMRELYAMIQQDRPDLRFGLSPAGIAKHGCANVDGLDPINFGTDWQYDDINSDPVAWLKDGSIDFISPQIYWFSYPSSHSYTSAADYTKLCEWWSMAAARFGRHFYSSIAPYRMNENEGAYNNTAHWKDLSNQISLGRQHTANHAPGIITYSAKYMDGPVLSGWGDYLETNDFKSKSLIPIVDWKEHSPLEAPEVTRSGNTLSWTAADQSGATTPIMRYTVYAVPVNTDREHASELDGDGLKARYLQTVVYGGSYTIPEGKRSGYWYAVCAYDGYGYESEPCLVDYPDDFPPVPTVERDETVYPQAGNLEITNLWFRNTNVGNMAFDADGKRARGMIIMNGKVYVSRRAEDSAGPCYLTVYDLESGNELGEHLVSGIPDSQGYPCNDIIRDNKGNVYLTNISLNISSTPLNLYKVNLESFSATLFASLTAESTATRRVDHCGVRALDNGTFKVYAALSGGTQIVRWNVTADGSVSSTTVKNISKLHPASAANFGIAAKVFPVSDTNIVVDGGATAPAEYNFDGGTMVSGVPEGLMPDGLFNNGFAHFGPAECYIAYPSADHNADSGHKFNITHADSHELAGHSLLWQIPAIDMGNVNSSTMSAPVDAVTAGTGNAWTSHVAIYVPGNGLAVYKISPAGGSSAVDEIVAEDLLYSIVGGSVVFSEAVESAALYDLAGRTLASGSDVRSLPLPGKAGVYILRYGDRTAKLMVR